MSFYNCPKCTITTELGKLIALLPDSPLEHTQNWGLKSYMICRSLGNKASTFTINELCRLCRHQEYMVEGVSYMRMKFYIKGTKRTGVVHLDMKEVWCT